MANLDKLLKKIEKNSSLNEERTVTKYVVGGETYEVLSMTHKQKRDFIYAQKIGEELKAGSLIKSFISIIYDCFQLKDLAIKAKEQGYIRGYYEVVETLFTPSELLDITVYLMEVNNINGESKDEALDDIKKQ